MNVILRNQSKFKEEKRILKKSAFGIVAVVVVVVNGEE